jgi:hypothetical protein
MMFFIRCENSVPIGLPMSDACASRYRQQNNSAEFVPFIKAPLPNSIGVYDQVDTVYVVENGVGTERHVIRPMTTQEREKKQDEEKRRWAEVGFQSWVFNEDLCQFEPPVPRPIDGKKYSWDEAISSWVEVTDNG